MVYYRKYRPQTIAQLDNPKLREILTAVLSQKEIPHAFLFTGPKGLGKTSTARIIAKVINCIGKKRDGIEPCNECDQCVSIMNGSNIDVLEIDGASNRGIDEIRELRERVNLAPSAAKMKVYIIDEVHMLTNEAFNALLKTIEEPPAHVVFIFATTEPQKVPETIISRCFHISLDKATEEEISSALERISKKEGLKFKSDKEKEEIFNLIAKQSDGGYRDAVKLLEEFSFLSQGEEITKEKIEKVYKTLTISTYVFGFFEKLYKKEKGLSEALNIIKQVADAGIDLRTFIEALLQSLHTRLIDEVNNNKTNSSNEQDGLSISDISQLVTLFSDAYQQTKYAPVSSLPLELAIVAWCQQGNDPGPDTNENENSNPTKTNLASARITVKDALKKEQNLKVKQVLTGTKSVVAIKKDVETITTQTDLPKDIRDNTVLLDNLIYKVKQHNVSVAGVLRSCVVQSVSDDQVIFQTAYTFHKERLEDNKSRELLERVLKEITGKNLRASVILKAK